MVETNLANDDHGDGYEQTGCQRDLPLWEYDVVKELNEWIDEALATQAKQAKRRQQATTIRNLLFGKPKTTGLFAKILPLYPGSL